MYMHTCCMLTFNQLIFPLKTAALAWAFPPLQEKIDSHHEAATLYCPHRVELFSQDGVIINLHAVRKHELNGVSACSAAARLRDGSKGDTGTSKSEVSRHGRGSFEASWKRPARLKWWWNGYQHKLWRSLTYVTCVEGVSGAFLDLMIVWSLWLAFITYQRRLFGTHDCTSACKSLP